MLIKVKSNKTDFLSSHALATLRNPLQAGAVHWREQTERVTVPADSSLPRHCHGLWCDLMTGTHSVMPRWPHGRAHTDSTFKEPSENTVGLSAEFPIWLNYGAYRCIQFSKILTLILHIPSSYI